MRNDFRAFLPPAIEAHGRRAHQIRKLRSAGLGIAWTADLQWDGVATLAFGSDCRIGKHAMVMLTSARAGGRSGSLTLGHRVHIGEYNNIRPGDCSISIGSDVLFAQFVSVIASNHLIRADGSISWHEVDPQRRDVRIGDDCWLGAQSVILPGVTLGDRCVVGAGAVVTKSFPTGSRLAGVPAAPL